MSNFKLFLAAFCALTLAAVSCSRMDAPSNIGDDPVPVEYEVGLSLGGEMMDVSYSSLTKSGDKTDSTLYVVSVWYCDSTGTPSMSSTRYAHGVFSDISKCKLKVLTGKNYCIRVKAVIDGVANVYHYKVQNAADSCDLYKDQGRLTNDFFYYSTDKTDGDFYSNVRYGDLYDLTPFRHDYSYFTVFYGGCVLKPSSSLSVVPIDMFYSGFKINITVNGLKDTDGIITGELEYFNDNLSFSSESPSWTSGIRSLKDLESMLDAIGRAQEARSYERFYAYYRITIDNVPYNTTFASGESIYFYRKKVTNITINVDHRTITSRSNSFNLTFDNTDFSTDTKEYEYGGTIIE